MLEPLFATAAADQAGELYCTLVPGLSTTPHNYPTTSALTAFGSFLGLCKAAADPLSPPCEVAVQGFCVVLTLYRRVHMTSLDYVSGMCEELILGT